MSEKEKLSTNNNFKFFSLKNFFFRAEICTLERKTNKKNRFLYI